MIDDDNKTLEAVLDSLFMVMSIGEKLKEKNSDSNAIVRHFQSIPSVLERIEQLQYHSSDIIYKKTIRIMQKYFKIEDEFED